MKLTYWYCECLHDSEVYNIRAKTKREANKIRNENGPNDFGPATKVTVEYYDKLDLLIECMGEGSGYWETQRERI